MLPNSSANKQSPRHTSWDIPWAGKWLWNLHFRNQRWFNGSSWWTLPRGTILDALLGLDVSKFNSRTDIDQVLANQIPDHRLRGFLLTNLRRTEGGDFMWGTNLRALDASRSSIAEGLARGRRYDGPVLFMRGENSNYLSLHDLDSVKEFFPDVRIQTVRGAGHWIHADAPEEFIVLVNSFLEG